MNRLPKIILIVLAAVVLIIVLAFLVVWSLNATTNRRGVVDQILAPRTLSDGDRQTLQAVLVEMANTASSTFNPGTLAETLKSVPSRPWTAAEKQAIYDALSNH